MSTDPEKASFASTNIETYTTELNLEPELPNKLAQFKCLIQRPRVQEKTKDAIKLQVFCQNLGEDRDIVIEKTSALEIMRCPNCASPVRYCRATKWEEFVWS